MLKSISDKLKLTIEGALRQYSLDTGQRVVAIDITTGSHRIAGVVDYEVTLYPSENPTKPPDKL